jgi:hypothetical protein
MISKKLHRTILVIGIISLLFATSGCKDMFKNPLQDKETGEDITVLLMDRNFIETKLVVHLQDMSNSQVIENEPVKIEFTGSDASNLITFGGNKQTTFNTSAGLVEVGYDPNVDVNAQNPIELTVVASSQNYISAPQFISYTSDGIKDLVISMHHKSTLKSANIGAFGEPFDLIYNGQLHSPQLVYQADFSDSPTGTAWEYMNLYSTTVNGTLVCTNLKDNVLYADYGAYYFNQSGGSSLMPPALPTKNMALQGGDYVYSTVLRSGINQCDDGLTIHVERANNAGGSGVFDYLITFSDGKKKAGKISCSFSSDNMIEQIHFPSANPAVKVELFGDAQYSFSPAVNLPTVCGANASFTATPKSNLKTYKLITRYSCPESAVGMGLSVIGEFRKKGTTDSWTSFKFIEGVCELQLVADADYDFRINIDGEYYYYDVPTNPDKVKAYLEDDSSPDFKFRNLSIISTETLVTITTDVQFSQAVCDLIQ